MELAEKLFRFGQLKKSETQNITNEDQPDLVLQINECKNLLRQNETLFNFECEPELIEAHIYEREALMVRYGHLVRQAKIMGLRVAELK